MLKIANLFLLATIGLLSVEAAGKNVSDIRDCPPLTSRTPPKSVHDLRPDDIKVIGALGDSLTAGFLIKGFTDFARKELLSYAFSFQEYRGLSYNMGGDFNAPTIPNYMKHYQPELKGYSTGLHFAESCDYDNCNEPYIPNLDVLNAAQSGATAYHLDRELTYLIDQMKRIDGLDFENDWKMINIQIGSNDMCKSCKIFSSNNEKATPEKYEEYVEAALDRIQASIPKVLVNVLSTYNMTQLITSTRGRPYCAGKGSIPNVLECSCALSSDGLKKMNELSYAYDKKLFSIYERRQKKKSDTFAVVYQPHKVNFDSCPPEYFSNIDCFHPGTVAHNFLSKATWNQFFVTQANKRKVYNFDYKEPIYCPSDSDRIFTN